LAFDVFDAESGSRGGSLGYLIPTNGALNIQIPNVHNVANATAALLVFTWYPREQDSISYSLNGKPPHTTTWQYGAGDLYKISDSRRFRTLV
jgi:hypothetical protein